MEAGEQPPAIVQHPEPGPEAQRGCEEEGLHQTTEGQEGEGSVLMSTPRTGGGDPNSPPDFTYTEHESPNRITAVWKRTPVYFFGYV